jgi:hypothetical protein
MRRGSGLDAPAVGRLASGGALAPVDDASPRRPEDAWREEAMRGEQMAAEGKETPAGHTSPAGAHQRGEREGDGRRGRKQAKSELDSKSPGSMRAGAGLQLPGEGGVAFL